MKNISLIFFIIYLIGCTNNEAALNSKENLINQKDTVSVIEDLIEDSIENNTILPNQTNNQEAQIIVAQLINASKWLRKEFNHWYRNQELDSIELIILNNAKSSRYFSSRMLDSIESRIKQPGKLNFHRYFYNAGRLSETFGSFSTKDSLEINKNLVINNETANYTTHFTSVMEEVPHQEEGYEWILDIGKNKERWLFSVLLVKENGEWKIDLLDKKFTVYNK